MSLVDLRNQKLIRTGDDLVRHLETFSLDLKFSAGVWFFAPAGGRFHDRYVEPLSIEARLEKAVAMQKYGLAALEAHYPAEINEDNLDLYRDLQRDTGLRLITVIPGLFYDAQFEFGSLSSPIESVRREAINRTITSLEFNQELDTDFAIVWPGIDGYENTFAYNHAAARARFAEGLREAMEAVSGVRICLEPKPYEPRGHILYGTTAEAILCCEKVESGLSTAANRHLLDEGHALVGLNPEVGHILMASEDLASSFSLVCEYGRLGHTHWNSQPLGNYDQDLNVGVIAPEQTEAALYALKMHEYTGYFGVDINPERMPVERALLNNFDALRGANERVNKLDHARVVECIENPLAHRGELEWLINRARYGDTGVQFSDL
jgi:xylose isomerase